MGQALAEQRFGSYEDVKKWFDEWFAAKVEYFYWRVFRYYPKDGENVQQAKEHIFSKPLLINLLNLTHFFKKIRILYSHTWYSFL